MWSCRQLIRYSTSHNQDIGGDTHLYAGYGGFGETEAHKAFPVLLVISSTGPCQNVQVLGQVPHPMCSASYISYPGAVVGRGWR